MNKIVLFVLVGLFTSSVVAEEREVIRVPAMKGGAEVADQAPSGAVLRGSIEPSGYWEGEANEVMAKHCDLKTLTVYQSKSGNAYWICEKP